MSGATHCILPVEVNHNHTGRGLGQKSNDSTCWPLCMKHHREWEDGSGFFKGWSKETRRLYETTASDTTRAVYELHRVVAA